MVWKDRFHTELQLPDPVDKEASQHWIQCWQKDLSEIVRTLEFWKLFYIEGRKRRSQRTRERSGGLQRCEQIDMLEKWRSKAEGKEISNTGADTKEWTDSKAMEACGRKR
ncbi:hypothetical protein EDD18DRAFT_1108058 [Armillaria luteobubalina]|uniref:Uncharacterized protein n=1 Tax=Armillaria luteobubalina TaxID=153913 RepID=A0AA39Q0T5_9AGAR|nr:hypothetical protein EDD18DRAFT_1108058 [Armillaria luteobubalina]